MSQRTASNGWDRSELNIKLSKRRRAWLAVLTKDLAPGSTPTEAIDRALELAALAAGDDGSAKEERLGDLEDAIERSAMEQRLATASVEESVRALAKGIEDLRALISEVASQELF